MSDQAIEDVEKERGGCLKPLLLLGVLVGLAFAAGVLIFGSVLVGPTELGVKTVQFDLPGFLRVHHAARATEQHQHNHHHQWH